MNVSDYGLSLSGIEMIARVVEPPFVGKLLCKVEGFDGFLLLNPPAPGQLPTYFLQGNVSPDQPHFPWFFTVEDD